MPKRRFERTLDVHMITHNEKVHILMDDVEAYLGDFKPKERALLRCAQQGFIVQIGDQWYLREEGVQLLAKHVKTDVHGTKAFVLHVLKHPEEGTVVE